jgi:DNA-binding NtrC family response regulator
MRDDRTVPELAPDFLAHLMQEDWKKGNLRELSNYVEREIVLNKGDVLHASPSGKTRSMRLPTNGARRLKDAQVFYERDRIEQALRAFKGNQSKAAESLGLKESTLRAKMAKHGIQGRRKLRVD